MNAINRYNQHYNNRLYKLATQGADLVPALLARAILLQDTAIWISGGPLPATNIFDDATPAEMDFLREFPWVSATDNMRK